MVNLKDLSEGEINVIKIVALMFCSGALLILCALSSIGWMSNLADSDSPPRLGGDILTQPKSGAWQFMEINERGKVNDETDLDRTVAILNAYEFNNPTCEITHVQLLYDTGGYTSVARIGGILFKAECEE